MQNKIVLVQFGKPDGILSIRYLSGILRSRGYKPTIISISPLKKDGSNLSWHYGVYDLPDFALENITHLSKGSLFLGVTVFTFEAHLVKKIYNSFINSTRIPIVVGGPHPTLDPYHSSFFSDYVCIGDGEKGIIQLADSLKNGGRNSAANNSSLDIQGCKNIFSSSFLQSDETMAKSVYGVESSVDLQSHPDYSFESEFFINDKGIVQITTDNAYKYITGYGTYFSRGCVNNCTYCAHEALARKSGFTRRIKPKDVSHFIDELKVVKNKYSWILKVAFYDPNILSNKRSSIFKILEEYKENVDLPLSVTGFNFNLVKEDILRAFLESGMTYVIFGIESAAEATKKLLNRKEKLSKIREVDKLLQKLKKEFDFTVQYDVIVDIPWETMTDSLNSLYFVATLGAYDYLDIFSLRFFPGTKLYQKALDDGIIKLEDMDDEYRRVYRGLKYTYVNFLFILLRDGILRKKVFVKIATLPIISKIGQYVFCRAGKVIFMIYKVLFEKWVAFIFSKSKRQWKSLKRSIEERGISKTLKLVLDKLRTV